MRRQPKAGYEGLNQDRYDSQELLRILFEKPESVRRLPSWQVLVGAAFSLWRSAFLREGDSNWDKAGAHAYAALEFLLKDNAFGYQQEKRCFAWLVSLYLNNAEYRVALAATRMRRTPGSGGEEPEEFAELIEFMGDFMTRAEQQAPVRDWGAPPWRWSRAYVVARWLSEQIRP